MPSQEKKVIEYNNNMRVVIKNKNLHMKVYKCPYYDCDKIFFSQDDLNQHLIYDHAEIPKNIWNGVSLESNKYFNKTALIKLNAKYKKEELKHLLTLLGYEVNHNFLEKLKRWSNARRAKL